MEADKGEAIMICLDNSWWMESIDSPMFQDQIRALTLYCEEKFKNPDTTVGVAGMAGNSFRIYPTKSLERIITSLQHGVITIGGHLHLVAVARAATFRLDLTDMKKRIVFFAGGSVCDSPDDAEVLGKEMKVLKEACDVISFGDPYKRKREFFDMLISCADDNGNCNVCHVPPESSVLEAISRSSIFIPHVGGGIGSAQYSRLLRYYKEEEAKLPAYLKNKLRQNQSKAAKNEAEVKKANVGNVSKSGKKNVEAVDIFLKPPSDGADPNTDCPFCQTVLLTLKEKGVPYKTHYIDLLNKPEWIPKQLETLPFIKFDDGTWASNSDVIVRMIDYRYQGHTLATPTEFAYLGLKILPKLEAILKKKDEKDGSKQALLDELKELEEHLSEYGGSYVDGNEITAVDLSLAPKLYHLEKACLFYEKWDALKDLPKVLSYTQVLYRLPSFMETAPSRDNVHKRWEFSNLSCALTVKDP